MHFSCMFVAERAFKKLALFLLARPNAIFIIKAFKLNIVEAQGMPLLGKALLFSSL